MQSLGPLEDGLEGQQHETIGCWERTFPSTNVANLTFWPRTITLAYQLKLSGGEEAA
jgi:hypothetical protein